MSTEATPVSGQTASTTSSAGSSSTSSNNTSSSAPQKSMSTAEFKRSVLGKPTPKYNEDPGDAFSASESSFGDSSDLSTSDDISEDNDSFAEQSVEEQVQASDDSPAEIDWSWAEPLSAYREGIHGVATAELLQALANGELPEALFDKLSLTMKDGDEEWTGNIADLRNGAQMHANYTRSKQALAQEKNQFHAERDELIGYLRSWKEDESGEKGLMGLEKMLGEPAVYRIATKLAERLQRKEQLEAAEAAGHIPPGTAKIVMEREALARQAAELERYKARQEERAQQQDVSSKATELGQRINREAINQFKAAGITQENGELTEGMWNLFKEELSALWTDASKAPSPVEVRTAVMAAKQRSERIVKQHLAARQSQKPAAKPAVSGTAPAGATGAPKKAAQSAKSMSTKEFRQKLMNNGRPFGGR